MNADACHVDRGVEVFSLLHAAPSSLVAGGERPECTHSLRSDVRRHDREGVEDGPVQPRRQRLARWRVRPALSGWRPTSRGRLGDLLVPSLRLGELTPQLATVIIPLAQRCPERYELGRIHPR